MARPKHLSVSQVNMYLRCPLQYMFRYIEGLKLPPKSAMTLSKSIHFGIEGNYRQKVESHKDLSLDDVLDTFSTDFEARKHETLWDKEEKPPKVKDEGIGCLSVYHQQVAPKVQPAFVEQKFVVDFENFDMPLLGYIDLIDEPGDIIDHKTTSRAPSMIEKDIQSSLQLTAYSLGYRSKFQKVEKGIRADVMFRPGKKKGAQVLPFPTTRNQQQIDRFLKTMAYVAEAIERGLFYPCQPSWACSPEYCGFYDLCMKEW